MIGYGVSSLQIFFAKPMEVFFNYFEKEISTLPRKIVPGKKPPKSLITLFFKSKIENGDDRLTPSLPPKALILKITS